MEFRWEALYALNHPQLTQFQRGTSPPGPVAGAPSRFLNRDFTDTRVGTMWVRLKLLF